MEEISSHLPTGLTGHSNKFVIDPRLSIWGHWIADTLRIWAFNYIQLIAYLSHEHNMLGNFFRNSRAHSKVSSQPPITRYCSSETFTAAA